MINFHPWYSMTEAQILEEIGKRMKAIRLNRNITQKELGELIGKGADEISRIEKGKPITMVSFLRLLRAVDRLENLDKALELPAISPMDLLKQQATQKKRASKKRNK